MYPNDYTQKARLSFVTTLEFDDWLTNLKDSKGKARIASRLISAELGNFGDTESVGERVSEMKIHTGPGYRVYFSRQGEVIYLLLCGGDKSSQRRDIKHAKQILCSIERDLGK
ncbi:MAG: type II toxin-antitoxin system RelE/ParE family toxin [Pseudomonas sp.]